ncbi:hypothetical protein BJF79_27255 [Actinomadura sp. CNU-125]|nr:hypothetical protein BJF79_27255 [Actinomadura sp. CNU-125]
MLAWDADQIGRRGFLCASAAGLAAAVSPALTEPGSSRRGADAAAEALTFTELTGGSVTGSPDGRTLIAQVQGVLWRVP